MNGWLIFLIALAAITCLSVLVGKCMDFGLNGRRSFPPPPARLAGSGSSGSPLGSLPVRADDPMREWDIAADLDGMDWGPR